MTRNDIKSLITYSTSIYNATPNYTYTGNFTFEPTKRTKKYQMFLSTSDG